MNPILEELLQDQADDESHLDYLVKMGLKLEHLGELIYHQVLLQNLRKNLAKFILKKGKIDEESMHMFDKYNQTYESFSKDLIVTCERKLNELI
jgi:hypothetical protein